MNALREQSCDWFNVRLEVSVAAFDGNMQHVPIASKDLLNSKSSFMQFKSDLKLYSSVLEFVSNLYSNFFKNSGV